MKLFRSNTPPGCKILVIYDDPQILTLLRLCLQRACKDTVLEAADGNEGLAKAQATIPDLIIIEVASSEQDSYEICKQLKRVPVLQSIPILFIGAPQKYNWEVYDLGAQGFLVEPFGPNELIKARNELLKGKTYWSSLPHDPWLLFNQSK